MPNSFERISPSELMARSEREAVARVKAGKPAQISPATVVDAAKDEATVYVYDAIGGWCGLDPQEWVPAFNAIKAKTIHLRINSPGGSVMDAEAMRTAIAQHPSKVVAHIDGMAASAATSVAIAADEVEMSSGAWWMIHNAWGLVMGGAQEMRDYADLLEKINGNILAEYDRKTGKGEDQVRAWMDAETWFPHPRPWSTGSWIEFSAPPTRKMMTTRTTPRLPLPLASTWQVARPTRRGANALSSWPRSDFSGLSASTITPMR